MKTPPRLRLIGSILTVLLLASVLARSQTFSPLHEFGLGNDGSQPTVGLSPSGNFLYGVASAGGSAGNGTIFRINLDGSGFTNLYNFSATSFNDNGTPTNNDGASPQGQLLVSGNTLFGTTITGGDFGNGSVFRINTDGTSFTNLHNFSIFILTGPLTNSDGAEPQSALSLSGNTLYGTARTGGVFGNGTVFKVNTDGSGFTNLYSFSAGVYATSINNYTNGDGADPVAPLILSGNTLYGSANQGGSAANGTLFRINTDGSAFTNLHAFTLLQDNGMGTFTLTNSDGANPFARLTMAGNSLFGAVAGGGNSGTGIIFRMNPDGSDFTNLYNFSAISYDGYGDATNGDGSSPQAGLLLSSNTFFGTASSGGLTGNGTVFRVSTNGMAFTNLYNFSAVTDNTNLNTYTNTDGTVPTCELILSGTTLFGTATYGGFTGGGVLFDYSLVPVIPPRLAIALSAPYVVLTWPTNSVTFTLQSATNLSPPTAWNTVSPAPVVVNGQNTVSNVLSGRQIFYRLTH